MSGNEKITVTATIEDCTITVSHKIHLANPDNIPQYDFRKFKEVIKSNLKKKWEDPEFEWKCCTVKFKFVYVDSPADDADDKNLHPKWGRSQQSKRGPAQSTGDWFVGEIEQNQLSWNVPEAAHEVGHELGAGDRYVEVPDGKGGTKVLPDPNPKSYPKDGIMFDHDGTVKQEDIDEIMGKLGVDCPKDCCDDC